ncbi:MAG: thrombospondin type 3 repeat-containing protein [Deltaproteobacteria bacterium]|nr:thrombospondin type 3 repeat-containing protein [Deltaproteobacteria bacterium]MBI2341672.1 thrombospondin type 3 repeat-containing protein [Deltaproteobacteria bacterium]
MKLIIYFVILAVAFSSCGGGGGDSVNEEDSGETENNAAVIENADSAELLITQEEEPVTNTASDGNPSTNEAKPAETATITLDADKDGVPDDADNCPLAANLDQKNSDFEYYEKGIKTPEGKNVEPDSNGDACDGDLDGDGANVTYVGTFGSDVNPGTFYEPALTLQKGMKIALKNGNDVYVSAGTYNADGIIFASGIDIYGGFADGYGDRKTHSESKLFKTALVNSLSPITINVQASTGTVKLDGFYIYNNAADEGAGGELPDTDDYGCNQATVYSNGGNIMLSNNEISGSPLSMRPCGVLIGGGTIADLSSNFIDASGDEDAVAGTAAAIVESDAVLSNNILVAGSGKHSRALRLMDSDALILNNTIDGSSDSVNPKTAYGIEFSGGSFTLINNIVYTADADDQTALICIGDSPSNSKIENNILTTFPNTGMNAVLADCDGNFIWTSDFIESKELYLEGAIVKNNSSFSGLSIAGLLNEDYSPLAEEAVDTGKNLNDSIYGNIAADFYGNPRPSGSGFDMGAIEK